MVTDDIAEYVNNLDPRKQLPKDNQSGQKDDVAKNNVSIFISESYS